VALPRILHRQYSQQEHPRGLRQAAGSFLHWWEDRGIMRIEDVQPVHVAGYQFAGGEHRKCTTALGKYLKEATEMCRVLSAVKRRPASPDERRLLLE
jgi:hypothetical protein